MRSIPTILIKHLDQPSRITAAVPPIESLDEDIEDVLLDCIKYTAIAAECDPDNLQVLAIIYEDCFTFIDYDAKSKPSRLEPGGFGIMTNLRDGSTCIKMWTSSEADFMNPELHIHIE
jgi:hypothetical protein